MKKLPAFPEVCNGQISPGMSLRDWFAGMALHGLLANTFAQATETDAKTFAGSAYEFADAMLKVREVTE